MAGLDANTATMSIEHVTITSQKSFESAKAGALERLVPRIDDGIFVLLRYGERARREAGARQSGSDRGRGDPQIRK